MGEVKPWTNVVEGLKSDALRHTCGADAREQNETTVKNVAERLQSVPPRDDGCLSAQHVLKRTQVTAREAERSRMSAKRQARQLQRSQRTRQVAQMHPGSAGVTVGKCSRPGKALPG